MMYNTNIEDVLNKDGVVLEVPVGYSMWPMLKNRQDQIVIEKITAPLKKYDVVLYKRDSGKYVLHRILVIKDKGYVIRGDNSYIKEVDVTDTHIIGRLKGFYKGNRYIDCDKSSGYRMYVVFWRLIYPGRFVAAKLSRGIKYILRKGQVIE